MSKEKNNLSKNGKVINPISAAIKVMKLDWSKLNPELNEYLHERFPEQKNDSWYWEDRYSGLIEKNGVYIILTNECVFMTPEIFHIKRKVVGNIMTGYEKVIGFEISVFKDLSKQNAQATVSDWEFRLNIEEIEKTRTDVIVSLPEFMADRYKYNTRIAENEIGLIRYLEEETTYFSKKK
jgi:hypothetical protein